MNSAVALKALNRELIRQLEGMTDRFKKQSQEMRMMASRVEHLEIALDFACERNRYLVGNAPPKESVPFRLIAGRDKR